MSDEPAAAPAEGAPKKKGGKGLLIGVVAALLLGGGSFAAVFLGLIPLGGGAAPPEGEAAAGGEHAADAAEGEGEHGEGLAVASAYVPLETMVISLGPLAKSRHLKLTLQVEVKPEAQAQVAAMTPRIVDVLNTFLRAVDERDFELPRAMTRLRAQMLRRLQLVTPEGSVRDLLVQEFILN